MELGTFEYKLKELSFSINNTNYNAYLDCLDI